MTKRGILALCIAGALALCGCAPMTPALQSTATAVPGTDPVLPEAQAPETLYTAQTATLYFRFQDEPYLAPESRVITQSPSEAYELALLTALLAGPSTHAASLTALFPEGTRVLSTARQGRTLFVTLSKEIMNPYPDEPAGMSSATANAASLIRRQLCMQSLVATVTENCDVDDVQVLVEQTGTAAESLRLKQRYFLTTEDDSLLVGLQTRQEDLLLTPGNTLRAILDKWLTQDWARLYLYLAAKDPVSGVERPSLSDFVTAMENLPRLAACDFSGGSVSPDGRWATFTLHAGILDGAGTRQLPGRVVRLYRSNDLWQISLAQLTQWLEE